MTATEEMLRQSLHARADRTALEPTPMLDVVRRARELRRRSRRTTLIAAAAAVAAVGVPAGLALGSAGPDSSPSPADTTVTMDSLSDLPMGAPPAVDYVLDRTYVSADGTKTELVVDPGSVHDAAPYSGGVLVATRSQAGDSVGIADQVLFGPGVQVENKSCGGEELAVSGDGAHAAYTFFDNGCDRWTSVVLRWGPTGEGTGDPLDIVTTNGQRVEPVGVTADRVLYNVVDSTGGEPRLRVYTTDEWGPPLEVKGIARASTWDPTAGRVAGCSVDGQCVVVDEGDGSVQLTLDPGETPLSFSPDGRFLATATASDEQSPTVTVRDSRTGDVVTTLAGDDAAFQGDESSVAWEGSAHLLIARVDGDGEALVRLGIDGSAELATPATEPTLGGYLLPGA
ncbi:WD40 repeat domain-containing protein [Nocardioides astragali]|uniref:WD40 repeat domain-containing protein n=1 Tax=Nocardioides astragali TaxID=1776736 RepID=A0ABW2N298_9ACTN|nr:WD40 repeat domain-containing protein [Nocardioides astragali]